MSQSIILKDGMVFENSNIISNGGSLYVYVRDETSCIKTVFNSFIDPEKTAEIKCVYGEHETEYKGYTKLIAVRDEGNGLITAVLDKPEQNEGVA